MQYHQTDRSSGVRLIGGEMLDWSDRGGVGDLGVVPVCLVELLSRPIGPILLAGPRAARLLDQLPGTADVDVLVRSLPDAREIAAMASLRPGTTVWCGGVERFTRTGPYATIVVLDGPERLLTPDSAGMDCTGLLDILAGRLVDGGVLAALVANGMSVASWLELPAEPREVTTAPIPTMARTLKDRTAGTDPQRDRFVGDNANDRWWHGTAGFADRPPYLDEFTAGLDQASLTAGALWAVYPHPDRPSVLVDTDALPDDRWCSAARARAVAAQAELFATTPALTDPAGAVDAVFTAGLSAALAPAWLVLAGRGERPPPSGTTLAWSDVGARPFWGAAWTAAETTDTRGATTEVIGAPVGATVAMEGPLERSPEASSWPTGRSLELSFRDALASGNHQRIRALVRDYADWLREAWVELGDTAMAAVMDNVTITEQGFRVTDRSWHWHRQCDPDTVLARGIRRAAVRLLRAGLAHPWRADIAADELATTVLIMIGSAEPEATVQRAATVDAEWTALVAQVAAGEREQFVATQLEFGRSQYTAMPAPAPAYRETVMRSSRMATELEVRREQLEWLETSLRTKESRLAGVQRELDTIRASPSFRIGRVLTAPKRRIVRSIRRGAQRMVPPDLLDKAERAARRLLS